MSRLIAVLAIVALLALVACRGRHVALAWVDTANRAELRNKNGQAIKSISGERLATLKAILGRNQNGWGTPWAGVPIAPRQILFFHDATRLGTVGVGDGFLTVGPALDYARELDADEEHELQAVLKVPNN